LRIQQRWVGAILLFAALTAISAGLHASLSMPIAPEKRQFDSQLESAVAAQFWGQGVHSSRLLTGTTSSAPCEPVPLGLLRPTGVNRTQFIVASQAVRVPAVPAWCGDHGGLVGNLGCTACPSMPGWHAVTSARVSQLPGRRLCAVGGG
jgi:hypothetical protein